MAVGYSETPFERIVAVGWGRGIVGILTLTYSGSALFQISSLGSPTVLPEVFPSQPTLALADYRAKSILRMENNQTVDTPIATLGFTRIIIDDGVAGFDLEGDPNGDIAAAEARQGRPANIIIHDEIINFDSSGIEFTTITHPNGSESTYISGFTPLPLAGWDQYIWTHDEDVDQTVETIAKQDWFVNFGSNPDDSAAVQEVEIRRGNYDLVPYTYTARLRTYRHGGSFSISPNGALSTPTAPRYDVTKEWSSTLVNTKLLFDQTGFLGEIVPI